MPTQKPPDDRDGRLSAESLRKAGNTAAEMTNAQLDEKIAALTSLTKTDIKNTFPTKADKQKLMALMQLVQSAKSRNDKINAIVENSEKFAGIILSLLGKLL